VPSDATYLYPGQIFASKTPSTLTTILGSCVAVCLFDPALRVGGMNHFVLPHDAGARPAPGRFGNLAVDLLLAEMLKLGCDRARLQAKLFGGASVVQAFSSSRMLGAQNVEAARQRLAGQAVPVVAHDVGGERARKLIYETGEGTAWVRSL
jgi:chemotaxis protein CheD